MRRGISLCRDPFSLYSLITVSIQTKTTKTEINVETRLLCVE